MRPVDQTTFGVPGGNCFSACVASLLHVPIEEVPYFMDADDWIASLNEWLRTRGFYALYFRLTDAWRPAGYYILGDGLWTNGKQRQSGVARLRLAILSNRFLSPVSVA